MNRAATHPGLEASGQIPIPSSLAPDHMPAFYAVERLVSNPVLKLLGGAIVALCSFLVLVLLWSVNLKLSTIETHLIALDRADAELRVDVRELREWRARTDAWIDQWGNYRESVKAQAAQGEEFIKIMGEIRDRLPLARK